MQTKPPIILNKGAIPSITQEIYYQCDSQGKKSLNVKLTIKEFKSKLCQI